jgi:hypothetical protein
MEVMVGTMVLSHRYHVVAPFHKAIHRLLHCRDPDVSVFKRQLLRLNPTTFPEDSFRLVERYLDPWWMTGMEDTQDVYPLEGLPDFITQV